MATNYKKSSEITTKSNIDLANDKIMAVNGTSNYNISAMAFKDMAAEAALVNVDGVFIVYHQRINNRVTLVEPYKWANLESSGEIAEGVLVFDGIPLVVATKDIQVPWCSANVNGGGFTTVTHPEAFMDMAGRANTTAQLSHTECQGAGYAAGYCNAYHTANANNIGFAEGRWWHHSVAELMLMKANKIKINYALSLISGATPLNSVTNYWASTEVNKDNAWVFNLGTGFLGYNVKSDNPYVVRPVTALY